jgi:hypothetical protein
LKTQKITHSKTQTLQINTNNYYLKTKRTKKIQLQKQTQIIIKLNMEFKSGKKSDYIVLKQRKKDPKIEKKFKT